MLDIGSIIPICIERRLMRANYNILIILGFFLFSCSPSITEPVEPIQNPTLPVTWTPRSSYTPDLPSPEIGTQLATQDLDQGEDTPLITSTGEAKDFPSSLPVFTGGDQWLVTIPDITWPYIATMKDGGFLVLGLKADHNEDRQNILFRLDARGEILWERILQPGYFFGLLEVGDGGMLLVFTQSLTKLDSEGNIEWQEYLSYDQDRSPFISSFYYFQSSQIQGSGQALMFNTGSISTFAYDGSFISQRSILSTAREGLHSTWLTTQAKWTAGQEGHSGIWVRREGAYTSSWLHRGCRTCCKRTQFNPSDIWPLGRSIEYGRDRALAGSIRW
jgi:hypothetical protein